MLLAVVDLFVSVEKCHWLASAVVSKESDGGNALSGLKSGILKMGINWYNVTVGNDYLWNLLVVLEEMSQ